MKSLTAVDARAMAALHALCFERGWPALDMAVHVEKDMCIGDDPLHSFIICRVSADQAEVLTLATHPDHRGQGLGKAALDAAIAALRDQGVKTLFLEVAEDNVSAISLYRASGFVGIGRRPAYYRREKGRVAALTFSKTLDA